MNAQQESRKLRLDLFPTAHLGLGKRKRAGSREDTGRGVIKGVTRNAQDRTFLYSKFVLKS